MKNYAIDLFFVLKKGIAAKIVLLRCVFLSIEEYWVIIEEFYKRNWQILWAEDWEGGGAGYLSQVEGTPKSTF